MYSKVFNFDQKVQKQKQKAFVGYEMQQYLLKRVKFYDLSTFAVILHFFNKIRMVVVRFFKNNLFGQRLGNKTYFV